MSWASWACQTRTGSRCTRAAGAGPRRRQCGAAISFLLNDKDAGAQTLARNFILTKLPCEEIISPCTLDSCSYKYMYLNKSPLRLLSHTHHILYSRCLRICVYTVVYGRISDIEASNRVHLSSQRALELLEPARIARLFLSYEISARVRWPLFQPLRGGTIVISTASQIPRGEPSLFSNPSNNS